MVGGQRFRSRSTFLRCATRLVPRPCQPSTPAAVRVHGRRQDEVIPSRLYFAPRDSHFFRFVSPPSGARAKLHYPRSTIRPLGVASSVIVLYSYYRSSRVIKCSLTRRQLLCINTGSAGACYCLCARDCDEHPYYMSDALHNIISSKSVQIAAAKTEALRVLMDFNKTNQQACL